MGVVQRKLTRSFQNFFNSEKSSGILLIFCTALSLALTNSIIGAQFLSIWQLNVGGLTIEHWINDGLMAIFFLLIGLELEREMYNGELSDIRNALLPIFAALGGIIVPALIYFTINSGAPTRAGAGIPMATDIAFALGVLAMLGSRVPDSLKIFLTALAVIDDLGAIVVIAIFYTAAVSPVYLIAAISIFGLLLVLNRVLGVMLLLPYLIGGIAMWILMMRSGVHASISGVLLAFAIPFSAREDDEASPSHTLEHFLHKPVAFLILPLFALANTGIVLGADGFSGLLSANSLGIAAGLVAGKPLGIMLLSFVAVGAGICRLPLDLNWKHIFGAGLLGGIGFTMSIFIANLAFAGDAAAINTSKMSILVASLTAGTAGFVWLRLLGERSATDDDSLKAADAA